MVNFDIRLQGYTVSESRKLLFEQLPPCKTKNLCRLFYIFELIKLKSFHVVMNNIRVYLNT